MIARQGHYDEVWSRSDCVLGRLLAAVRPLLPGVYDLYAFDSMNLEIKPNVYFGPRKITGLRDSVFLAVIKTRDRAVVKKTKSLSNRDETFYSLRETGFVSFWKESDDLDPSKYRGRLLEANLANFHLVRDWLNFCASHHTTLCSLKPPRT